MSANNMTVHLETESYKQFRELCQLCQQQATIGLAFGRPGAGKTDAAKKFARWSTVEPNVTGINRPLVQPDKLFECNALYYLPSINTSASRLRNEVSLLRSRFDSALQRVEQQKSPVLFAELLLKRYAKLLIVDEAYRLKFNALEELRDIQDEWKIGMVLIADRIGFVQEFKQLYVEEVNSYIDKQVEMLALEKPSDEIYAAVFWYTQGNLRTLEKLFKLLIGSLS